MENQFDALEAFEFAAQHQLKTFVLGGGSNILVSDEGFNGLVIKVVNKGIEVIAPLIPSRPKPKCHSEAEWRDPSTGRMHSSVGMVDESEDRNRILLKVASGEVWDEVVKFAVKNNWWGIENLSHIPGSTGAIAVQNVGAYGQEASGVIESVTVFNKDTHSIQNFQNADCGFAYRQSIFNSSDKGKYIIFDITFKLLKSAKPNLEYRDLKNYFGLGGTLSVASKATSPPEGENADVPALSDIRNAIISIRNKKFPFPVEAKKGNAGSFFKNPILSPDEYIVLRHQLAYKFGLEAANNLEQKKFTDNGQIKVPAAFLIDLCGLKNLKSGGAAINQNQPLVITNESGTASAKDVLNLANQVKQEVFNKTGLTLKFEPELIGF